MADYEKLRVWQEAHRVALRVYAVTQKYPKAERFSLTQQTRRAAASIASNISEGAGRGSDRDFARFVRYSVGSANEVEYQLRLAADLGYVDPATHADLRENVRLVRSMLGALGQRLTPRRR
ncbi:MAG: four helix bundle protein [Acidimicrobiia bacterium]